MTDDARFEDGQEAPLRLGAVDVEDLRVLSALVQDAVLPASEIRWLRPDRKLALLINRFRWEMETSPPERAQAVLVVSDVLAVASQGIDRKDADTVLSILSVEFEPGEDGAGHVLITLAGDGALRARVEALDVALRDVTRPYIAVSGRAPTHDD